MENKPIENDSPDDTQTDYFDEESKEELGSTDVDQAEVETLTLDELNELAGRKDNPFKSKDEFVKHYGNLKSFAGKVKPKEESPKPEVPDDVLERIAKIEERDKERDFVSSVPEAKDPKIFDLTKAVAKEKNISYQDAWENHVKDMAENYLAKQKEKVVIDSKQRITPTQAKNIKKFVEKANSTGLNDDEQLNFIAESGLLEGVRGK